MSTGKAEPVTAAAAVAAGAIGHLLFDEAHEDELAVLMFSTQRGEVPGASRMARRILALIAAAGKARPAAAPRPSVAQAQVLSAGPGAAAPLSPREMQVLRLVSQGMSNRRIAVALSRSANTIDTQIKSIYRKLAVNSRTQAVHTATERGLLRWDAGSDVQ